MPAAIVVVVGWFFFSCCSVIDFVHRMIQANTLDKEIGLAIIIKTTILWQRCQLMKAKIGLASQNKYGVTQLYTHTFYTVSALFHSAAAAAVATTQPRPTPSIRVRKYLTLSNAHIYMKIEMEKMATKI